MRKRRIIVVAGAALLALTGMEMALAQRGIPKPVPAPIFPTPVPMPMPQPKPMPLPQPVPMPQPAPMPAPIPAPNRVDPCRNPNPPDYCSNSSSADDGGGEDSCSSAERSCSATATSCLQGSGIGSYYYVGNKDGRPVMFRRSSTVGEPYSREMNLCWDRLDMCLRDRGC